MEKDFQVAVKTIETATREGPVRLVQSKAGRALTVSPRPSSMAQLEKRTVNCTLAQHVQSDVSSVMAQ